MARDRLAALRAQRQQGADGQNQGVEMSGLNTPDQITSPINGAGNGSSDPMSDFYAEVSSIQDGIAEFSANVARISELHSRSLNSTDESVSRQNAALLDDLGLQTRRLSTSLKERIQALDAKALPRPQDARVQKNQIGLLRSKFVEVLQNYQTVERDYRARYRQRVERQFKIVKPDATQEEVNAVVDDVGGGGDQIFSQALSSSTRYGESRAAYREVQDRHEDIRRIERTLVEVAQLISDMDVLVTQQGETIDEAERKGQDIENDMNRGVQHTEKAVEHARSARRKRWYCFFLCLLILAIVGIVVGVTVGKNH